MQESEEMGGKERG